MLARVALVARAARADARLRSRGLQPRMLVSSAGDAPGRSPVSPSSSAHRRRSSRFARSACALSRSPTITHSTTVSWRSRTRSTCGVIVDAAGGRVGLLAFTDHPREHRARPAARGVGAGGPSAPASGLADGRAGAAAPRDQGSDRLFALGAQHEHRAGPLAAAARGGVPCCGRRPRRGATPRTSSTGWSVMSAASRLTTSAARSTTTRSTRAAERPGPARSLEPGWRLGARARRSATALRLHGARSGRGRRLDRDEAGPGMRGARARP